MLDCSKDAVLKLVVDAGIVCAAHHNASVQGVTSKRVQVDEVGLFVHAKQKNVPQDKRGEFGYGEVWTWTAIDADSGLMIARHVGRRDAGAAHIFINDVADRLATRVQLTSDGNHTYLSAVDEAFGRQIDYAMLIKQYGESPKLRSAIALRSALVRKSLRFVADQIRRTFRPVILNTRT